MKKNVFDSLCAQRVLLEMLYEAGLTEETLQVSRGLDDAQLDAWREKEAAACGVMRLASPFAISYPQPGLTAARRPRR